MFFKKIRQQAREEKERKRQEALIEEARKKEEARKEAERKAKTDKRIIIGCVIVLILCLIFAFIGSMLSNKDTGDNTNLDAEEHNAKLSFVVTTQENIDNNTKFTVKVEGKTDDGNEIKKNYDAKINSTYDVNVGKGKYKFSIDTSSINTDINIFKNSNKEVEYDGITSKKVNLKLELDTDAMKKKQAEASSQQKAQQQSGQSTGEVAKQYILVTTTNTFHLAGCRALKRVKEGNSTIITATYSEMIARGYKPCGICL